MDEKEKAEEIGRLISDLDTACGMLLVASATNLIVRAAMEKVSKVSFRLGLLIDN